MGKTTPIDRGRKPTNLTLDAGLLAEARALSVNLSRAAEAGIRGEVDKMRARQWQAENQSALQSSNDHVAQNGLPLEHLRPY